MPTKGYLKNALDEGWFRSISIYFYRVHLQVLSNIWLSGM